MKTYRVYIVETDKKTLKTRKRYREGVHLSRSEAEKAVNVWIKKTGKFHDIEEID